MWKKELHPSLILVVKWFQMLSIDCHIEQSWKPFSISKMTIFCHQNLMEHSRSFYFSLESLVHVIPEFLIEIFNFISVWQQLSWVSPLCYCLSHNLIWQKNPFNYCLLEDKNIFLWIFYISFCIFLSNQYSLRAGRTLLFSTLLVL